MHQASKTTMASIQQTLKDESIALQNKLVRKSHTFYHSFMFYFPQWKVFRLFSRLDSGQILVIFYTGRDLLYFLRKIGDFGSL